MAFSYLQVCSAPMIWSTNWIMQLHPLWLLFFIIHCFRYTEGMKGLCWWWFGFTDQALISSCIFCNMLVPMIYCGGAHIQDLCRVWVLRVLFRGGGHLRGWAGHRQSGSHPNQIFLLILVKIHISNKTNVGFVIFPNWQKYESSSSSSLWSLVGDVRDRSDILLQAANQRQSKAGGHCQKVWCAR